MVQERTLFCDGWEAKKVLEMLVEQCGWNLSGKTQVAGDRWSGQQLPDNHWTAAWRTDSRYQEEVFRWEVVA